MEKKLTPLDQFTAFVRRKEREAIEARLPQYVTIFDARPADALTIGNDWTRRLFDGDFYVSPPPDSARPACSLVFVQSAGGNTGAANPSHLGGGETDKHLIYEGLSRVAADAVMAGAGTARGGRMIFSVWHPELVRLRASLGQPRHPIQIIATLRGIDVEHEMLFNVPEIRVVLLTVRTCETSIGKALSSRPWITPVVMDEPRKTSPRVFSASGDGPGTDFLHRRPHAGDAAARCEPGPGRLPDDVGTESEASRIRRCTQSR